MNVDDMTPSEAMLTRRVEILEGKLKFYENMSEPNYSIYQLPEIIPMHQVTQTMQLAIMANIEPDGNGGYHVFGKDERSGYKMGYYVSNFELNSNRYRSFEFLNKMMRDVTMTLAENVDKGKA